MSRAGLDKAARGKASLTDMGPMRPLSKTVGDGFCTGCRLACELVAIVEHLEGAA
jgi:hypothetical protein